MITLKKPYADLLTLTQLYLFQEFSLQDRIFTDPQTYEEFKQFVLKQKGNLPPIQQTLPETPKVLSPLPSSPPLAPPPTPTVTSLIQPVDRGTPSLKITTPRMEEKTVQEKPAKYFELEPLSAPSSLDISDFHAIIQEKMPSHTILNDIPSDSEARKINQAWKQTTTSAEVIILSFQEVPKQRTFLDNLSLAINIWGIKASVFLAPKFERENSWELLLKSKDLRLVIASHHAIHAMPQLMKHYKESPKNRQQYLDKIPLLLLSDLAIYLKEPSLKASLWKGIQERLSQTSPL